MSAIPTIKHEHLCRKAEKAAAEVHGDTEVSLEMTLSSLRGLRDYVDTLIECVKGDMRDQEYD